MTPTELILSKLTGRKRKTTTGWTCQCPAHDDRRESLSVGTGDDGRALVKCHAGCTNAAIMAAMGLRVCDQFVRRTTDERRDKKSLGRIVATYDYTDEAGKLLSQVVRYDPKDFRQRRPNGDGWIDNLDGVRRVLFKLPELIAADPSEWVFVCEGEKDVLTLAKAGLIATTNLGGAGKWKLIDDGPLLGRRIAIPPHNDKSGADHALDVAKREHGKAAVVKIVNLDGLPPKGDVSDWLPKHSAGELMALVEAAPIFDPATAEVEDDEDQTPAAIAAYIPFPSELLPEPLRSFVIEAATTRRVDGAFIALTTLAVVAACIGTTRCIRLRRTWREFAILWGVLVARSGTMKSPCFDLAMEPLRTAQNAAFKAFDAALDEYEREKLRYETALADWKRDKKRTGEPPEKPNPPVCVRMVVSDVTTEGLAPILKENCRGVLLARDELRGWIGGFDAYKNAKGGDSAFWLEVHRGGAVTIDRKTGQRVIHVPMAAVSVAGTIQPTTFKKAFTGEHFGSGLVARMLLAWPPTARKSWYSRDVSQNTLDRYGDVIAQLLTLRHDINESGDLRPIDVQMTADARTAWIKFYGAHADRQADAGDDNLAAAFAKHEAHAARFALSFALVEAANRGDPRTAVIEVRHVEAGAALAGWFCGEAERLYAMLARSDEDRELDGLVEFIQRRGGAVTVRDVQRSAPSRFRGNSELVREHLDRLRRTGIGVWETAGPGAKGGRPVDRFRLKDLRDTTPVSDFATLATGDTTQENDGEFDGFVSVASVATSENEGSVADPDEVVEWTA